MKKIIINISAVFSLCTFLRHFFFGNLKRTQLNIINIYFNNSVIKICTILNENGFENGIIYVPTNRKRIVNKMKYF